MTKIKIRQHIDEPLDAHDIFLSNGVQDLISWQEMYFKAYPQFHDFQSLASILLSTLVSAIMSNARSLKEKGESREYINNHIEAMKNLFCTALDHLSENIEDVQNSYATFDHIRIRNIKNEAPID